MQLETVAPPDADAAESPDSKASDSKSSSAANGRAHVNGKPATAPNGAPNGSFPTPKTDKPRPHVCGTCNRSFARLEHLKRHERSHTKEKPFECPECNRCFARRDLLLRHQQKLHMTTTPSSRPRNGRRESASGASAGARGHKNAPATGFGAPAPGVRPRANTISHLDLAALGLPEATPDRLHALGLSPAHSVCVGGLSHSMDVDYPGAASLPGGAHGHGHGPAAHHQPKLNLDTLHATDPIDPFRAEYESFSQRTGFDLNQLFGPGSTVNPAQLHFEDAPASAVSQSHAFDGVPPREHPTIPEGDDFGWMRNWNLQTRSSGRDGAEHAIDESSPSRISSGDSPGDYSESLANSAAAIGVSANGIPWSQAAEPARGSFQLDVLGLQPFEAPPSPHHLHDPASTTQAYLDHATLQHQLQQQPQPQPQQPQQHPAHADLTAPMQGPNTTAFAPPSLSNFSSDSPSISSSSMAGSVWHSSVSSTFADSITDATRQALLTSLSQPSLFGHNYRKPSQPCFGSSISPGAARNAVQGPTLPSTADIRRYVEAYIHYTSPHLPVTHIPTMSFDSLEYYSSIRGSPTQVPPYQSKTTGGAGCLILAMAAIGALYEYDHPASKDLFEAAKKMIGLYLEERRTADMSAAMSAPQAGGGGNESQHTPIWLVKAMLLNVVYGHQCGDKVSADIASNHCAALVSLAKAAQLGKPPPKAKPQSGDHAASASADVEMREADGAPSSEHIHADMDLQTQWLTWKEVEGRKRTLFAIFVVSSILTSAYNLPPTIMNSEILLDLPCDEDLWTAPTAQEWHSRGGLAAAEGRAVSFADALTTLLTAKQRQGGKPAPNGYHRMESSPAGEGSVISDLKPSTFGCLVLISALHNYIWETRSRHHGRDWTSQETESMIAHIEPALNAWQAAWKASEHHRLERPNPFGLGPLSADSIPMLDLAFVRLFVNLGPTKEAFCRRDFDAMAEEMARGPEIVPSGDFVSGIEESQLLKGSPRNGHRRPSQVPVEHSSSRRERHLRKAAFYAADSLTIASRYNLTYADMSAHELPIQAAMCFFDCSQVLAEWAITVQERVGRYLGVLGRDNVDFTQVPAIMLLESEDVELLGKLQNICDSLESKRFQQENLLAMDLQPGMAPPPATDMTTNGVSLRTCGYGSKLLRIIAMMLEKAVIWPVTHVTAKALETQAGHMDRRAEASRTL